ncbi:putative entry exclusion protein TrbK-alt [Notoacmeibacter marinus]|uniref:putative entry exclusion protein TrbK-alt n=1 Tax=Notoacmeibacter marinus TaxID=1876515 RepID=UPI000DF160CF|nr:putative entry exclusion protein TrbK-alt [Notoacmeibacter marinus]
MNGTVLARLAAAAFLAVAVVVAIVELGRQGEEAQASRPVVSAAQEATRTELQRCQALGEAALDDQSCLDAWAEKRRRFLTTDATSNGTE